MRNLKRALSLALASVMLLGMMVVGASAAESYTDVDADVHNIEAIDVLQVVNVMNGYAEDGDFHPEDLVTRAQMARIMAELLNLDYDYYEAVPSKFTDVTGASAWAKKYVDACAANGIVSGRGNGIYDPTASVTAVEAASMMMRALGYFQNVDGDYEGGFEAATVKQASQISLFSKIYGNAHDALSRNQVAQLALNTLESNMVYFDGDMGWEVNGVKMGYRSHYSFRTGTEAKYGAIDGLGDAIKLDDTTSLAQGQYYVNLGEQLYDGKLVLDKSTLDVFGRPSRHWEYDGQAIGTYVKKDLIKAEYTTEVTGRMLYDLIGKGIVDDAKYTFVITIDGETEKEILNHIDVTEDMSGEKEYYYFNRTALNHTNTNQVGGTGNGVLTQVFVDGGSKTVYISIINTYLAVAAADYSTRKGEITLTVWNITQVSDGELTDRLVKDPVQLTEVEDGDDITSSQKTNLKAQGDDFEIVKDLKADDIVLVRVAEGEIKDIFEPTVVDNASINEFKLGSYVVADRRYDYASTALYNDNVLNAYNSTNMKNSTYVIYVDPFDYLIGIDFVAEDLSYAFLTGINSYDENLRDATAIGNLVFLDGTSKNVTIDMKESKNAEQKSFISTGDAKTYKGGAYKIWYDTKVSSLMNTWVSFSVDDAGVYTLTEIANTPERYNATKPGQHHQGGSYYKDEDDAKAGTETYYVNNGDGKKWSGTASSATRLDTFDPSDSDNAAVRTYNEEYIKINKSNVELDGIPGTVWAKVYGNDDSIYLSAETAFINAKRAITKNSGSGSTTPAIIITGASSVGVGVQDVELVARNAPAVLNENEDFNDGAITDINYLDVSHGVYTLFDKNGYVIAAMVVGEDDGSNVSFAWVSSTSLSREALVNGKWEYSRDVIIDGKEATLTEVETSGVAEPDIKEGTDNYSGQTKTTIEKHQHMSYWWVVRTKADGTVKDATPIDVDLSRSSFKKYIYDIADDTKDGTVILNQSFNVTASDYDTAIVPKDTKTIDKSAVVNYKVQVLGNTLQVEGKTGVRRGFAVNPNASIAVVRDEYINRNNGKIDTKYKTDVEFFTNDKSANGLKQAVNSLTNKNNYVGYIAAVLKDGRAECVIFYEKRGVDVEIDKGTSQGQTDYIYATWGDVTLGQEDIVVSYDENYYGNAHKLTSKTISDAIAEFLGKEYKDSGVTVSYAASGVGANQKATATVKFTSGKENVFNVELIHSQWPSK